MDTLRPFCVLPGPNGETFSIQQVPANLTEAEDHLRSLAGKEMTTADGMTATVSNRTAGKMVSASAVKKSATTDAHLAAIGFFEELFTRGSIAESKEDREGNQNIKSIHRIASPMDFNGRSFDVKFTVKELVQPDQGNLIYSIEAVETSNATERKRADATAIASPTSAPQSVTSQKRFGNFRPKSTDTQPPQIRLFLTRNSRRRFNDRANA